MLNVKTISETLKAAIQSRVQTPAKAIANIILLCGLIKRPGLSAILSLANIAQKMGVLGIPTGEFSDGTPNRMMQFTSVLLNEVYRALREDAQIRIVIGPGGVKIVGAGGGTNPSPVDGHGHIM